MSKLQPEVEGVAVLTKNQIKDVFREGAINMPEFLQNVFSVATSNASTNKYKYVNYTFNWGVGFAISALFLSTLIPKMQYWITKMTTGQDKFPGTADYSQEKNAKK